MIKYETIYPGCRHVIIYHASCADGFCAAVVLWEALIKHTDIECVVTIPAHYGQPVPSDLTSNDVVYLVDFSYKLDILKELVKLVKYIIVLDHHKTARDELNPYVQFYGNRVQFIGSVDTKNIKVFFDMSRSGARLAFDFVQCMKDYQLHSMGHILPATVDEKTPNLVRYVEDRDLWKFKLPHSKEISAYLRSIPFNLEEWNNMLGILTWDSNFDIYVREGEAILRFQQMQINDAVNKAVDINFPLCPEAQHGMPVKIVNTTVNHSEVGEELCTGYDIPFAVTWFYRGDGKFQYSLRSHSGYDVSKVAKAYGGGGHPAAAGFESDIMIKGTK